MINLQQMIEKQQDLITRPPTIAPDLINVGGSPLPVQKGGRKTKGNRKTKTQLRK